MLESHSSLATAEVESVEGTVDCRSAEGCCGTGLVGGLQGSPLAELPPWPGGLAVVMEGTSLADLGKKDESW